LDLTPPLLGRAAIARLVPHSGAMCLLDRALAWDAEGIVCEAEGHRDPGNPLRRDGRLPAICGVEYALQAMALHGALTAGGGAAQPAGYLSSLRDVSLGGGAERLDTVPGPLRVRARALAAEAGGFIYRFEVEGGGRVLLAGQAAIILPRGA
jgi:predicted hotdog family 3-hydroxylacyl-ACP dehydratase